MCSEPCDLVSSLCPVKGQKTVGELVLRGHSRKQCAMAQQLLLSLHDAHVSTLPVCKHEAGVAEAQGAGEDRPLQLCKVMRDANTRGLSLTSREAQRTLHEDHRAQGISIAEPGTSYCSSVAMVDG